MTAEEIRAGKKQMRKEVKKTIMSLERSYCLQADEKIRKFLVSLPEYAAAKTVFCFVGDETEINTSPFLEQILADGKTLAVPLCVGQGIMEARQIGGLNELTSGYYGLLEPAEDSPLVKPESIDLAVIPCVSCNHTGARLGHGGGFYDIYFSRNKINSKVMICREKVMREDIPVEAHDLTFDCVISEEGVFRL